MFSEYHAAGAVSGAFMLRKGKWKYNHYVGFPPELFDLENDPEELNDLGGVAEYAEIVAQMHAALLEICDPDVVDAWGIPVLNIDCRWRDNEVAMFDDMADSAAEMLEAAGVRNVEVFHEDNPPGKTIHEMGTARMGRDPSTSVLNGFNQAHDVPNLFVIDGSCMASSANQNPSLTYMALTARAVAYAVEALNRREL